MDVATIETKIKADLSWLQKHERIVLATIAGLTLWFGIGKIDTLIQNHDMNNFNVAKAVAQVQAEKNTETATLAEQQAEQYKALAQQVATQNAQLTQTNAALSAALAKQQKVDASLPPSELVNRWYTLVPEAKPTVTPTGVALDNAGAVATVQQLELVPVQQQKLVNVQEELGNAQKLVEAEGTQVATLNALVTGKDALLADNAKVCAAQVATVKAEARKSKRRWFYAGMATTVVLRVGIKLLTGI